MNTIRLPKMGRSGQKIVSIMLFLVVFYAFLNAIIVGLALVSLIPSLLNTAVVLPWRATMVFLIYAVSACAWATVGVTLVIIAVRVWKSQPIFNYYLVNMSIAIILLALCHWVLTSNLIAYLR